MTSHQYARSHMPPTCRQYQRSARNSPTAGTRDSRYSSSRSPDTVSRMSSDKSPRRIHSASSGGCGMPQLLAFSGRTKPRQMVSCVFRASFSARNPSASTV